MNSIDKTKFYVSYSQQAYVSIIVNYSYNTNGTSPSCRSILPNKRFFLHDITLIASVVGESAIGHGIGGIDIPAKWRNLLKACCRSKQRHKLVTQSHSHSNRLMALRSKYVYMPRSMGKSYTEYPPPR